jgi:toxin ParE1/3/4
MKRRILRKPAAQRDLVDHFHYIGRDSERAAMQFLKEAEVAFARIANMPGIGPVFESIDPRLQGIRHTAVSRRFRNYLIFYRVGEDFIEILTIVHGSRDLPNVLPELF